MTKPRRAWMVRAGNENVLADLVGEKKAVAIGWPEMGDLSALRTLQQCKQRYHEVYPGDSAVRTGVNAGQIYRFARKIQEGHYILTYLKASREVLVGEEGLPSALRSRSFFRGVARPF